MLKNKKEKWEDNKYYDEEKEGGRKVGEER